VVFPRMDRHDSHFLADRWGSTGLLGSWYDTPARRQDRFPAFTGGVPRLLVTDPAGLGGYDAAWVTACAAQRTSGVKKRIRAEAKREQRAAAKQVRDAEERESRTRRLVVATAARERRRIRATQPYPTDQHALVGTPCVRMTAPYLRPWLYRHYGLIMAATFELVNTPQGLVLVDSTGTARLWPKAHPPGALSASHGPDARFLEWALRLFGEPEQRGYMALAEAARNIQRTPDEVVAALLRWPASTADYPK